MTSTLPHLHSKTATGFSLPSVQEERIRSSLESLCDDLRETATVTMDTSLPYDMAPDYGDDETETSFSPQEVSDLSSLPHLTEYTVLQVIKDRYEQDKIFTRCGDVLISVNPFKQLTIFNEEAHETYSLDCLTMSPEPEAHLFHVAAQAIARRSREKVNQVILVSGESGAGKTEATKLMLRHILHLSTSKQDRLYEGIDKVNPLLELFGNARTQLNGNSSRFAKFLEVNFTKDGAVSGATLRDYILEKSRVVSPSERESTLRDYILEKSRVVSPSERECNFHIFYTFLEHVMASPDRQKLFLMEGMDQYTDFRIVPAGSWRSTEDRMSSEEQTHVFKHVGVGSEEVENMHMVLAAILHLTNIRFEDDDGSAGGVMVENEDTMRKAAALLNVDAERLARVLVTRKTVFSGEMVEMLKSCTKAEETRDAMAKALYERLFGWLIRTINTALNRQYSSEAAIGFMDICGFEDLHHNSLEQMSINLANEHMQSFMNAQVFKQEMKIYGQEGISLGDIQPPSNEDILRMFDMPKRGILALINEDTRVEISTDKSLVQKLCHVHAQSLSFTRYKNDDPRFGINHFAAPVWYDAHQFLEKNGDALDKEVKDILVASNNELVSDIFQVEKAPTGSIAPTTFNYRVSQKHPVNFHHHGQTRLSESVVRDLRQSLRERFKGHIPSTMKDAGRTKLSDQRTVIDCFQTSMKELLDKMKNAHPLFVRCIKPNDQQQRDHLEERKVRLQLRYNGVTEIARIRKFCFPVRLSFKDFIQRYCILSLEAKKQTDKKEAVALILRHIDASPESFKMGKTMLFFKDQVAANLDKALEKQKEEERRKKEDEQRRDQAKQQAEKRRKIDSVVNVVRTPLEPVLEVPTPGSSMVTASEKLSSSSSSFPSSSSSEQLSTDGTGGGEEVEETGGQQEEEIDKFWDIFRIVAREQDRTDIHHMTSMKIIKMIAYIFILSLVLATSTAQRVSLMVMVAAMRDTTGLNKGAKVVSTAYYILMMVAVCIPYLLTMLTSLAKVAFGGFRNPSVGTWIWVFLTESLHTIGLTLLVFRVLPRLDVLYGLLLLSAVGIIPSVLKLVTSVDTNYHASRSTTQTVKRLVGGFLDCLAFAGQVSVFPAIYVMSYVHTDGGIEYVLDVAGAMLVSVACWENFLDGRFFMQLGERNPIKNFMLKRRYDLQRGRYIPQLVLSVWKIALTIVLAYLYRGEGNFNYEEALSTLGQFHSEWKLITSILVLTLSAIVCYYFSYIACKLWMQRISFVIPLTLSTPCAIVVFVLDHKYHFLTTVTGSLATGDVVVTWPKDALDDWPKLVLGGAWFLSLLLLTRHVWWPRQNRLAKFEMMFMNPLYCGILTMETLFLNRRRHTLNCRKKRVKETIYYCLDKTETLSNENQTDDGDYMYAEIGASAGSIDPESPEMIYGGRNTSRAGHEEVPMIYACATMWHEVRREMVALLKSLHRIDLEQWTRKQAQEISGSRDKDYFEYEAHIFFDDAMTLDDDEEFIPNDYVKMVVDVMEEAVSSVYKKTMTVSPPLKIPTPYGGQLLWVMPGNNLLFVHLKDKIKIRHRKRWSQVMYMYYLLGFRLARQCQQQIIEALKTGQVDEHTGWSLDRTNVVGSEIFEMLDEKVAKKSENTFVMALDGDTDFSPGSVHILLDRMKKNPKVAAACGRIHPIGSGPLVWYQMFEYAIGHWMQKATEHVLGCVLCSPGCFSLFRGSALMDDNVMRKYAILPTEPSHYLQYDQGEDRWLCTLLLQQGYRVDYAAAADAWTYAPEGFNEFFNQRRRWMPSTLANIMDLLADYSNTVTVNSNISMLYIVYQVALMVATLVGPGTVLMMIAGAIEVVFGVNQVWSYVISIIPAIIYLGVCIKCKTHIQLYLAALLSTFYAFVMMIVFVGVIVTAAKESIFHPSVLVIIFLVVIFLVAGLCHPMELYCLPAGALYLLCVPSGYLLLVIYSLCNLHVVSWGTREAPKKKTKAEMEEDKVEAEKKEQEKAKKKGFFSKFFFSSYLNDLKDIIQSATGHQSHKDSPQEEKQLLLLEQINQNLQKLAGDKASAGEESGGKGRAETEAGGMDVDQVKIVVEGVMKGAPADKKDKEKVKKTVRIAPEPPKQRPARNELENPKWIEDSALGTGEITKLYEEEMDFWKAFVKKYLAPLDSDKEKEKELGHQLIELRNQVIFGFSMINLLWMAINFMFQYTVAVPVTLPIGEGLEVGILGLLFVIFLLAILLLQIFGMIVHRWGTLLHLLAFTDVDLPCFSKKQGRKGGNDDMRFQRAFEFCQRIIGEPIPDYLEDDADVKQVAEDLRKSMMGAASHGFSRQSVVKSLNQSGVLDSNFINSNQVELYLRGTARRRDEDEDKEDPEALQFVSEFRSNLYERKPNHYTRNGYHYNGRDGGELDTRRPPRADGFAPPPPRRQNIGFNQGVRRRINSNNLRATARNTIQRYEQESGEQIPAGRRHADRFNGEEGRRGDGGQPGGVAGVMDRALSRRLHLLSDFSRGPGHEFGRGGVLDV
ncbi:hypothetical protein ACOMHN_061949 [Nucella lapillus]